MVKQKNKQTQFRILSFVVIMLTIGIVTSFVVKQTNYQNLISNPKLQSKTYIESELITFTSNENLALKLRIPPEYLITDRNFDIVLSKNEEKIFIDFSATDFESLDKYLENLDKKNNTIIISEAKLKINNFDAIERILDTHEKNYRKTYKIFIYGKVYDFFTNSPSLYPDLDQIAKSFEYLGDK